MKQVILLSTLAIVFLLFGPPSLEDIAQGYMRDGVANTRAADATGETVLPPSTSCAAPHAAQTEHCRELEAAILAVTVRLRIEELATSTEGGYEVVAHSIAHATVMGGRYLVTHNHFGLSLEDLDDGLLRRLSAYGPDGSVIVQHAPFHVFEVRVLESQTLVFDFGTYGREGTLAYAGLVSAQFADWRTLDLQPGDEVAQVNWDGRATFIDWVRVSRTRDENGAAALEVDNYAAQGASGGGIFYQGYHVANNWFHGSTEHASSGEVLRRFTVAALNGANLLAYVAIDTVNAPEPTAPLAMARNSFPAPDPAVLLIR